MLRIESLLAQSAISQMKRLDVISNNLANVNTVGYKKDITVFSDFSSVLSSVMTDNGLEIKPTPYGVKPDKVVSVIDQGALRRTDNPFDLAISGKGFFVLETPGGLRYSRAGNFKLDSQGYLVDSNGYKVQGSLGPIHIDGQSVIVTNVGEVVVDGQRVDVLKIVDFPKPYRLKKVGEDLFVSDEEGFVSNNYVIHQGFLEDSNVNPMQEMVEMIETHRVYEASANAIKTLDGLLGMVLTEVPRL